MLPIPPAEHVEVLMISLPDGWQASHHTYTSLPLRKEDILPPLWSAKQFSPSLNILLLLPQSTSLISVNHIDITALAVFNTHSSLTKLAISTRDDDIPPIMPLLSTASQKESLTDLTRYHPQYFAGCSLRSKSSVVRTPESS